MQDLFLVAGLRAKPGQADVLRKDLFALVGPSREEVGNISYDLFEDANDPGFFIFVEHWEHVWYQQQHNEESPHIRHFHANGDTNVASREFFHTLRRVVE